MANASRQLDLRQLLSHSTTQGLVGEIDFENLGKSVAASVMAREGIWDSNEGPDLDLREDIREDCLLVRDAETLTKALDTLYYAAAISHVAIVTEGFIHEYDGTRERAENLELEKVMDFGRE